MSSEDGIILEAARQTRDIIGLSRVSPTTVLWQEMDFLGKGGRAITPHFPVLKLGAYLFISPILQGRVASEDWGPILAPTLIFYGRLKRAYNIGTLIRVLPGFLFLAGFFLFSYLYIPHPDTLLVIGVIVPVLIVIIFGAYSSIRLGRKLVLQADEEAAEALGAASLVDVLRKLEALRERDASIGHEWPEWGDHPTLAKRIANLQNS